MTRGELILKIESRKGLTSYKKEINNELKHKTSFLTEDTPFSIRKFMFLNNLKEIPICPVSGEQQLFLFNNFTGYSKNVYKFFRIKTKLTKWLNPEYLYKYGLSFNEIELLSKSKESENLTNEAVNFQAIANGASSKSELHRKFKEHLKSVAPTLADDEDFLDTLVSNFSEGETEAK